MRSLGSMQGVFLAVTILLALIQTSRASIGDRLPEFKNCVKVGNQYLRCLDSVCSGLCLGLCRRELRYGQRHAA